MKAFFLDKIEYTYTSNKAVIQFIDAKPEAYTNRVQTLISHTLNAHAIWNNRMLQKEHLIGVWDRYEISELHLINTKNQENSIGIISETDLTKEVTYNNSKGITYTRKIEDILFHIINHSTYHRGQLITELKNLGIPPITTDFIFFKR